MTTCVNPSVKKVLLIDDDPDEQLIFQDALAVLHPSFELQWIDQTFKKPEGLCNIPDIAFVDVNMPGEDGFHWVRKLRSRGYTFPIVMLTNSAQEKDQREAYAAGANLFLTKPPYFHQLVGALEPLLFSFTLSVG